MQFLKSSFDLSNPATTPKMFRGGIQEGHISNQQKDSKLQAVFSKLSGVLPASLPIRTDFQGNAIPNKIMSSEIIESVLADTPVPVQTNWEWPGDTFSYPTPTPSPPPIISPPIVEGEALLLTDDCVVATGNAVCQRLEQELRNAKRSHLACGEVLLPCGLLQRVARDIVTMAESEPCGLRGCQLFILFEQQRGGPVMQIGNVVCDPATACTFELYLTLKQNSGGWNFLPQFLRNLTRGGTVVISPAYTLSKKKLYRTYVDHQ